MPRCWQPAAPAETPSEEQNRLGLTAKQYGDYRNAGPTPIRLRLSRKRLGVFATLATVEQRPVGEIIEECLADMAAHLRRSRHVLLLDTQDMADLDAYLNGIEAIEREEGESAARILTTPAMRLAAATADERERHPLPDLEEWDRTLPFGAVELALAID